MHVILVPGLWLDASAWDEVAPVLQEAGHSVQALTRTGDTLDEQVAGIVAVLDEVATPTEPVVLAGHSGAGPMVLMAADQRPSLVAHLLYVDTFPAPDGASVNDELPVVDGAVPLPPWDVWEPATVRGMTPALRRAFEERAFPEPAAVPSDPFHYADPARHRIPATVVSSEIPAAELAAMVAEHHAWTTELAAVEDLTVVGLETGHWPMFTAPRELGALLVQALAPEPTAGP